MHGFAQEGKLQHTGGDTIPMRRLAQRISYIVALIRVVKVEGFAKLQLAGVICLCAEGFQGIFWY